MAMTAAMGAGQEPLRQLGLASESGRGECCVVAVRGRRGVSRRRCPGGAVQGHAGRARSCTTTCCRGGPRGAPRWRTTAASSSSTTWCLWSPTRAPPANSPRWPQATSTPALAWSAWRRFCRHPPLPLINAIVVAYALAYFPDSLPPKGFPCMTCHKKSIYIFLESPVSTPPRLNAFVSCWVPVAAEICNAMTICRLALPPLPPHPRPHAHACMHMYVFSIQAFLTVHASPCRPSPAAAGP